MSEMTPEQLKEIRGVLDGSLKHVSQGDTDWVIEATWELLDYVDALTARLRVLEARGHECYARCCGGCPGCRCSREVCAEHGGHIDDCPDRCYLGSGAPIMECPRCVGKY
jgi:hypothetical protein